MPELRIVVGSGPNGVGVAHALLRRGFEVVMLDVGRRLEPDIAQVVATMARQEPHEWSAEAKAIVRRMGFAAGASQSPKLSFGSSYVYAVDDRLDLPPGVSLHDSHAYGGLSNVWGCALVRCPAADLEPWPDDVIRGVTDCYPAVEDLVTQSLGVDIFAARPEGTHLPISEAARAVLRRQGRGTAKSGFDIYPTPLAIAAECKACNACMYGCVYGYTYTTRATIEKIFMPNPRFAYVSDVVVDRYEESSTGVTVYAHEQATGQARSFTAKQLFLAAGMIGSLRIIWNSNNAVARTLEASDGSCFIVPGIRPSFSGSPHDRHHGQSHLSVDVGDPPFQDKRIHCQLYFNNPAVADAVQARHPLLSSPVFRPILERANRSLVAAQGYLHSDFCHALVLDRREDGGVRVSVRHNPRTTANIDAAMASVARQMRRLGVWLFPRFADVKPFGGSKTAGALPHNVQSTPHTTDTLGRPFGARNVFVTDASVLASTPGRNLTLTTLANAFRIGRYA